MIGFLPTKRFLKALSSQNSVLIQETCAKNCQWNCKKLPAIFFGRVGYVKHLRICSTLRLCRVLELNYFLSAAFLHPCMSSPQGPLIDYGWSCFCFPLNACSTSCCYTVSGVGGHETQSLLLKLSEKDISLNEYHVRNYITMNAYMLISFIQAATNEC